MAEVYSNDVYLIGSLYGQSSLDVASILSQGGPDITSTAILGAVLNEYNARLNDQFKQDFADAYSEYRLPTHAEIVANFEVVAALSPTEQLAIKQFGKLTAYPVMIDLGPGNIQLYTAINLLEDYNNRYPSSDPLGIKGYAGDYAQLARDLTDTFSPATSKFAGLMIQSGFEWGQANVANWGSLTSQEKEAFAVFYYKVGENEMNKRLADADGVYTPDLEGAPIVQEFFANQDGIDDAVVDSFGQWWSDAMTGPEAFTQAQKMEYYAEFFAQYPEAFSTNPYFLNNLIEDVGKEGLSQLANTFDWPLCFAAGTPITLSDGTTKAIETISVGDQVLSYDKFGNLVSSRVAQLFRNEVSHLLDVHGLKVTPGHVTLCGDGPFKGAHVPIIDILLSDGALVRENGDLVRMAIDKSVGSVEDQFIEVSYAETPEDVEAKRFKTGRMRVGTLLFDKDGVPVSVLDCLIAQGYAFEPETGLVCKDEGSPASMNWFGALPRPEDYILRRSRETLEGILVDGEWEGQPSELIAQRIKWTAARLN